MAAAAAAAASDAQAAAATDVSVFDPIAAGKNWVELGDSFDLDTTPPPGFVPTTDATRSLYHPNGGFFWQCDGEKARQKKYVCAPVAPRAPAVRQLTIAATRTFTRAATRAFRVVMDMLKKAAGGVLRGEISLISLSIPVGLFEPRSHLERIVDSWVMAPYFLNAAADMDPLMQMKHAVVFCITGLEFNCKQQKPFNPILGETYQARFPDGTQVFCEQFAHHPPVSGYEMFGPDDAYHLFGHGEWHASFSGNSVKGHQTGRSTLRFRNGTAIHIQWPHIVIRGLLMGDRIIEYAKEATFVDRENNLTGVLTFNPDATGVLGAVTGWFSSKQKRPADYFVGAIYRGERDPNDPAANRVCEISGSWLGWCEFDGVRAWDIANPKLRPFRPIRVDVPLPSDCGYRLDVVRLAEGDTDASQSAKSELEVAQRQDEALRKAAAKKRKAASTK